MSAIASFKCDKCKTTCDHGSYDSSTFCGDCWTEQGARIKELEKEVADLDSRLDVSEGQRETEAEVFASQIREKDVLIQELLAKVHAA